MADDLCIIPYQDAEYPLSPRDITVSALRYFKGRYGPEYGAYRPFLNLFLQGDADAIACAIHIVLKKNGINRPPEAIDFAPYDVFEAINRANELKAEREAAGEDPTGLASFDADGTINDSTPTPTPSETSTSES